MDAGGYGVRDLEEDFRGVSRVHFNE